MSKFREAMKGQAPGKHGMPWAPPRPNHTRSETSALLRHDGIDITHLDMLSHDSCLVRSELAFVLNFLKVLCDQGKAVNDERVHFAQSSPFLSRATLSTSLLEHLAVTVSANQTRASLTIQVVDSIHNALGERKGQAFHAVEHSLPIVIVSHEQGFTERVHEMRKKIADKRAISSDLTRDLNKDQQSLRLIPSHLSVSLARGYLDSDCTGAIGGFSEPIGDNSEYCSRDYRCNSAGGCPCLPLRDAGRTQPPTSTNRIPKVHVIFPTRIWLDSDTPFPGAAADQLVSLATARPPRDLRTKVPAVAEIPGAA